MSSIDCLYVLEATASKDNMYDYQRVKKIDIRQINVRLILLCICVWSTTEVSVSTLEIITNTTSATASTTTTTRSAQMVTKARCLVI